MRHAMTRAATLRAPALLLAAVAMATLFVASGFTASAQGTPTQKNCNPPADEGKWIVEGEHVVCVGRDITVSELRVWKTSTVELHDVNLYLDTANTPPGQPTVSVGYSGDYVIRSKLIIRGSHVEALDTNPEEKIAIGSRAALDFIDSNLHGLRKGISVATSVGEPTQANIEGSSFYGMELGITDFGYHPSSGGTTDVEIKNNFFDEVDSPIYTGYRALIEGNTIVNCITGIELKFDSAHPVIRDNTVTACASGIGQSQSQSPQEDIFHNDVFGNCQNPGGGGNIGVHGKAENNWWGDAPPGIEELNSNYHCVPEPNNPTPADYTPWLTSPRHPERLPTPSIASLPSSVVRGESIAFDASGSQPSTEFGFALKSFEWSFGDGNAANGKQVSHAYQDLGSYTVKLHVKDEKGLGHFVEESVQVVNQDPEVDVSLASGFAGEDIVATIDASDVDGDALTTTIEWLRNGVTQPFTAETVPGDEVGSSDVWEIRVLVEDGFGGQDEAIASVQIPNRSPTISGFDLLPDEPVATDSLEALADSTDPDGDDVDLSYAWRQNGELQADLTGESVEADRVESLDTWQVTVSATDAHGATDSKTASVSIPNREPEVASLEISPASPFATDSLEAVASATDPDEDDVTLSYEWRRNGEIQVGLTQSTVPASRVRSMDTWSVTVTATDSHGATDSATQTVDIPNREPDITSLAVAPEGPRRGDALQVQVEAVDADGDAVTLAYTWHRNGQATDETESTVPGEALVRGDSWRVTVTATDGHDEVVESSGVVQVQNTAPEVVSLSLDASEAGQEIEAAVEAIDVDGDDIDLDYEWRQNGQARSDLTGPVVSGSEIVSGDEWVLTVTPSDDALSGEPVSVKAVIGNHAPVIESLTVSPVEASASTPLKVAVEVSDEDGDSVEVAYAWLRNDEATEYEGAAVPVDALVRGDSWRVRVTVTDGMSEAKELSAAVVIQNTPPEVVNVEVEPQVPTMGESVMFSLEAVDLDGDAVTVTWTMPDDSILQAAATDWTFLQAGAATVSYQVSDGTASVDGSIDFDVTPAPEDSDQDTGESDTDDGLLEDTTQYVENQSDATDEETQSDDSSSSHDAAGLDGQAAQTNANNGGEAGKDAPVAPWIAAVAVAMAWIRRRVK